MTSTFATGGSCRGFLLSCRWDFLVSEQVVLGLVAVLYNQGQSIYICYKKTRTIHRIMPKS